jgi:hypothetical protein
VDPHKLAYAAHLREAGDTIAEIVAKTGVTRSSLYRHLPPRPVDAITAAGVRRGRDLAGEHGAAARLLNPRAVDHHSMDAVIAASACAGGGMAAISAPIRSAASR